MMVHKRVGFFFELPADEQKQQLNDLRRPSAHPDEDAILAYLSGGVDAGVSMMIEEDLLQDPPEALGEAILRSDGEWVWPASLVHYVREYHVELPKEFVNYMQNSNWKVPENVEFVPEIPEGHIEM